MIDSTRLFKKEFQWTDAYNVPYIYIACKCTWLVVFKAAGFQRAFLWRVYNPSGYYINCFLMYRKYVFSWHACSFSMHTMHSVPLNLLTILLLVFHPYGQDLEQNACCSVCTSCSPAIWDHWSKLSTRIRWTFIVSFLDICAPSAVSCSGNDHELLIVRTWKAELHLWLFAILTECIPTEKVMNTILF